MLAGDRAELYLARSLVFVAAVSVHERGKSLKCATGDMFDTLDRAHI